MMGEGCRSPLMWRRRFRCALISVFHFGRWSRFPLFSFLDWSVVTVAVFEMIWFDSRP